MESLGEVVGDGTVAKEIHAGLPPKRRKAVPVASPADIDSFKAQWGGKSVWAMWSAGPLHRYHVLHWALAASPAGVGALARFLLRVESLYPESQDKDKVCKGLEADSNAAVANAATAALPGLIDATRTSVYGDAFGAALAPLLAAFPDAEKTSTDSILSDEAWTSELVKYVLSSSRPVNESDFTGERLLGVGGFGMVMVGFKKDTGRAYALKRQNVSMVIEKTMVEAALIERKAVCELRSRFILDAEYAYHDNVHIVIALRIMPGGDVHYWLQQKGSFSGPTLQFYLASVVLGLEALHGAGFVYRDLKDRNVLLDAHGQARIADFGLAGDVSHGPIGGKMGTVGYHAPEQLNSKSHKDIIHDEDGGHDDEDEEAKDDKHTTYTTSPDFWTLGVCAYHWSTLQMPFGPTEEEGGAKKDKEKKKIKKRVNKHIKKGKFDEKPLEDIDGLESLCKGLMTIETEQRLGSDASGFGKLRKHDFFNSFDWAKLASGTLDAPIKPPREQMNAPPSAEMDMKKVKAYEGHKCSDADYAKHFGAWDYTGSADVATSLVEFLEKRALEAKKMEKKPDAKTTYAALIDAADDDTLSNIVAKGLPTAAASAGGGGGGGGGGGESGGGGGGCCEMM